MSTKIIDYLGISKGVRGTLTFLITAHEAREAGTSDQFVGFYDPYLQEINSKYPADLTNQPVDEHSIESIEAWLIMIHEWAHFMQFTSSSTGLFISINRIRQHFAFLEFCSKLWKAGQKTLYFPLLEAVAQGAYQGHERIVRDFLEEWLRLETRILSNQGCLLKEDGTPIYFKMSPNVKERLPSKLQELAETPLSLAHIVEPLAVGVQGQWLLAELGPDRAQALQQPAVEKADIVYSLLQIISSSLGIPPATQIVLYESSLMVPCAKVPAPEVPFVLSPTFRLSRGLALIVEGALPQIHDLEPQSYVRFTRAMNAALGVQPPEETVLGGLAEIDRVSFLLKSAVSPLHDHSEFLQCLTDHKTAFEIRRKHPDAFVCLTEQSEKLFAEGWQPVWRQAEGWLSPKPQQPEAARNRLLLSLTGSIFRTIMFGEPWNCPNQEECQSRSQKKLEDLPLPGSDIPRCLCRIATEKVTGSFFEPEKTQRF